MRAIQHAVDSGITLFDTAATDGTGHSEQVLGQALAGQRDQVVVASKFGFNVNAAGKHVTRSDSPEQVIANLRADCETSLRNLGTDRIYLY